jgi:hypothetical protein
MLVEQLRGLHAEVASLSSLVVRLRAQHSAAAAGRPGTDLGAAEHWLRPQALWSGTSDGTASSGGGGGGGWPSPHPGYVWAVATVRSRSWDEHID